MDLEKVIELYDAGYSFKTIQEMTGEAPTSIRREFKRIGKTSRSTKTDKEIEDQIIADYNNNISSEKLAIKYNMNPSTICRIVKRLGGELKGTTFFNRKYELDETFLDNIDTQEKAYFLGFMYSDGNVHKRESNFKIVIHNKDKHILHKFSDMFYGFDNIQDDDDQYVSFRVYSVKLTLKLIEHGCVPNKTFKLSFPKTVPEHLLNHFFRGLFDGDGCLRLNEENRAFINLTGYKPFLEEIQEYLTKTLGIFVRISDYKDKPNVSDILIHRNLDMLKMLDYLYKDATIYLDRKYNKYLDMKIAISETVEANPQHYVKYDGVDSCNVKLR
jgi:intein/homing endonuclease